MSNSKRISIPKAISNEIIWLSDRKCCVCKERGSQIHHLDGDSSNNETDNLALLCLKCHDEASTKSTISRNTLGKDVLTQYRNTHYLKVENDRAIIKKNDIAMQSDMQLYQNAYDALFAWELHSKMPCYSNSYWRDVESLLRWLEGIDLFRIGFPGLAQVLESLYDIATYTRRGMTNSIGSRIKSLVLTTIPISAPMMISEWELTEEKVRLLWEASAIGSNLVYNGTLYLNSYRLLVYGSEILRKVLRISSINSSNELEEHVRSAYVIAESGVSRSDLTYATEYLEFEKNWAMNDVGIGYIDYPKHLLEIYLGE